ncbi:unnamed protein product, partial [marine sediment metagenome]
PENTVSRKSLCIFVTLYESGQIPEKSPQKIRKKTPCKACDKRFPYTSFSSSPA